jgi:hypothetical protein
MKITKQVNVELLHEEIEQGIPGAVTVVDEERFTGYCITKRVDGLEVTGLDAQQEALLASLVDAHDKNKKSKHKKDKEKKEQDLASAIDKLKTLGLTNAEIDVLRNL